MSEHSKITASHRSRVAIIYVRQSTLAQLERNTESTARQYDLAERAVELGWPRSAVRVVDADLGVSGSVLGQRDGFESLVADVALGQVGIILALEVSRLARDNAAWYRLLDLAGACDTLVADADGVYHPGLFNDRLVLGMKGIMSEILSGRPDNTSDIWLFKPSSSRSLMSARSYTPSASMTSVSVRRANSSSRDRSALERASRETSNPNTAPTTRTPLRPRPDTPGRPGV